MRRVGFNTKIEGCAVVVTSRDIQYCLTSYRVDPLSLRGLRGLRFGDESKCEIGTQ